MYSKKVWLNPEESISTGSVVAFDGIVKAYSGDQYRATFLQVADCSVSARLVKSPDDTIEDFIAKMEKLQGEIGSFITYLKTTDDANTNV
jgi:hypothetical protein